LNGLARGIDGNHAENKRCARSLVTLALLPWNARVQLKLLAFAQAADQLGSREQLIECAASDTPRTIVQRIAPNAAIDTMCVALDQEYADWDTPIGNAAELALIPPVSGG
jgi:molybdopterin synthase sulfur carrier subunit